VLENVTGIADEMSNDQGMHAKSSSYRDGDGLLKGHPSATESDEDAKKAKDAAERRQQNGININSRDGAELKGIKVFSRSGAELSSKGEAQNGAILEDGSSTDQLREKYGVEKTKKILNKIEQVAEKATESLSFSEWVPKEVLEEDPYSLYDALGPQEDAKELTITEILQKTVQENPILLDQEKASLLQLLLKYQDRFSTSIANMSCTAKIIFDAKLKNEDSEPVKIRCRSQGVVLDYLTEEIMNSYVENELYEGGQSDFSSPMFLVLRPRNKAVEFDMKAFRKNLRRMKPDNSEVIHRIAQQMKKVFKIRIVSDYHGVNELIQTISFPLPDLKHWYHKLLGKLFLSPTDFTAEFNQIRTTAEAQRIYAVLLQMMCLFVCS